MVASYNNNEELPNEPDGVVAVWNTKYKKATPEDVFHCQSAVMSACFAKFHPNLILGKHFKSNIC
jgi:dynein intermediate chain